MFDPLFIISIIFSLIHAIKDSNTKVIPAENWANRKLMHEDIMSGISYEKRMENLENGKYKLDKTYPEQYKNPVIEDYDLYVKDAMEYGAYQAKQWVKQGKYSK